MHIRTMSDRASAPSFVETQTNNVIILRCARVKKGPAHQQQMSHQMLQENHEVSSFTSKPSSLSRQ